MPETSPVLVDAARRCLGINNLDAYPGGYLVAPEVAVDPVVFIEVAAAVIQVLIRVCGKSPAQLKRAAARGGFLGLGVKLAARSAAMGVLEKRPEFAGLHLADRVALRDFLAREIVVAAASDSVSVSDIANVALACPGAPRY